MGEMCLEPRSPRGCQRHQKLKSQGKIPPRFRGHGDLPAFISDSWPTRCDFLCRCDPSRGQRCHFTDRKQVFVSRLARDLYITGTLLCVCGGVLPQGSDALTLGRKEAGPEASSSWVIVRRAVSAAGKGRRACDLAKD